MHTKERFVGDVQRATVLMVLMILIMIIDAQSAGRQVRKQLHRCSVDTDFTPGLVSSMSRSSWATRSSSGHLFPCMGQTKGHITCLLKKWDNAVHTDTRHSTIT